MEDNNCPPEYERMVDAYLADYERPRLPSKPDNFWFWLCLFALAAGAAFVAYGAQR